MSILDGGPQNNLQCKIVNWLSLIIICSVYLLLASGASGIRSSFPLRARQSPWGKTIRDRRFDWQCLIGYRNIIKLFQPMEWKGPALDLAAVFFSICRFNGATNKTYNMNV